MKTLVKSTINSYINSITINFYFMENVRIYTSNVQIDIMDAKNILNQAGINYFEINKMDTAHAGILGGTVDLHVSKENVEKALSLLAELK